MSIPGFCHTIPVSMFLCNPYPRRSRREEEGQRSSPLGGSVEAAGGSCALGEESGGRTRFVEVGEV